MRYKILFVVFVFQMIAYSLYGQKQLINVPGIVTDMQGDPIPGAVVWVEGDKGGGATNDEGKFTIQMASDAQVTVSSVGYKSAKVKLNGRSYLAVKLKSSNTLLPEVTVTSKLKKSVKFVFASSELELIRDHFFLKTHYRVPANTFHKDSRLIIQPYLVNKTTSERKPFTPIVYDGENYDILLKRGNICGDPVEKEYYSTHAKVVGNLDSNEMISYSDSCTIGDINDQYETEVRIKISTFCKNEYNDTIVIAHGVIYPMRFFNYDCSAKDLDDSYAPAQTPISFDEKGQIHLRFRTDDAVIYENEGRNGAELKKLMNALGNVDKDQTKTLNVFQIIGYTSPEGGYEHNAKLAQERMKSATDKILRNISAETLKHTKVSSSGVVESWSQVYDAMVKDECPSSEELGLLMRRARMDHNEISWGARHLKSYSLIRDKYLPQLRRVEYFYEYSELRTLNEEELNALYLKSPKNLTASEFWSYICGQGEISDEKKEFLYRQALSIYPDLMIAANNLATLLIRQNRADTTLLQPFLTEDAPEEIWLNQTVALLQSRSFEKADQLAAQLPENENSRLVKALAAAMNGKYKDAYPAIAKQGGINQVVLLLCMKQNREAWDLLTQLDDHSAEADYLRAIAANRLDNVMDASDCLQRAIKQKPSLKEIAQKDADVLDLLQITQDK